jgi:gamma-tubulin complex component 3
MDQELSHKRSMHPSALSGNVGQLSLDDGFGGGDDENEHDGARLWEAKYQFQQDMLPLFVGETFGKKVSTPSSCIHSIHV